VSKTYQNLIGGEWKPAASGSTFTSVSPADHDQVIGEFPSSGPADVEAAVEAAKRAYPAWSAMPAPKRGEILFRIARLLAEHKEELSELMTREMGKVLPEARGDVQEAIDVAYYMAGEGRRLFGQTVPSEMPDKFAMAIRRPIGVVGIITPWNFPVAIPAWKLFPALICGNTAVLKPASDTPACMVRFVELLMEGGLPDGVVNVVTGSGAEVGNAIVDHPDVASSASPVTPTPASRSARAPRRRSSASPSSSAARTRSSSGKTPTSTSPSTASSGPPSGPPVSAARPHRGSSCTGTSTTTSASAPRARREAGARRRPRREDRCRPGDQRRAVERIASYAAIGRDEADLVIGGEPARDGALAKGSFFQPTIFTEVKPDARIAQEEIFGPVTSVIPVDRLGRDGPVVNGVKYGLSTSLFTPGRQSRLPARSATSNRGSAT
jgi:alpha-ketoglutaric semialdehyde dehydrogenase